MAKIDRSKYRSSDSEEMQKVSEEMKAREISSNRGDFLKVEGGLNTFRLFPAPLKAKSSLFLFPKVTSFLPFMVDEFDDKGNKTGKQVEKRKAIFNAKVHGGMEFDIVEEYIAAVTEMYSATIKDKKKLLEKIKPLTDFRKGIKPSSAWICYAYKLVDKKKIYGRLQLTDGVKKQMDTLCLREGEAGKPMVVDLFSNPDTGKMIQWASDPNNEDMKKRNQITMIFEKDAILEDEELEMLEEWDSLESLYTNSFTHSDFEKQLKGLQLYDAKNNLNVFESTSFQSIIEKCKEEVIRVLGPESDEDKEDSSNSTTTAKIKPTTASSANKDNSIPVILQEMDKKTLIELSKTLKLEVEIKNTTTPSKIRTMIKEALVAQYELEGSDEEINEAILDIIESALNDEGGESEGESENEDSNEEENNSSSEEEGEGEEGENEEESEETSNAPKRSSLLDKYRKK